MVEETGANDTAGPPDGGDLTQIQPVSVLLARLPQQRHPLGVGADLAGVESVPRGVDQFLAVTSIGGRIRAGQQGGSGHSFLFQRRDDAAGNRAIDGRDRRADVHRILARPLACALLLGLIQHHIHQRIAAFFVDPAKNFGGDFNQKAIQLALIPGREDLRQFRRRQAQYLL